MKALLQAALNAVVGRWGLVVRDARTEALVEAARAQAAETNFHAAEIARRDAAALRAFLQATDELLIGAGHSTPVVAAKRILSIALGRERQAEA